MKAIHYFISYITWSAHKWLKKIIRISTQCLTCLLYVLMMALQWIVQCIMGPGNFSWPCDWFFIHSNIHRWSCRKDSSFLLLLSELVESVLQSCDFPAGIWCSDYMIIAREHFVIMILPHCIHWIHCKSRLNWGNDTLINICDMFASSIEDNMTIQQLVQTDNKNHVKVQHYWPFLRVIHKWPGDSPHKGSVMQKASSSHGIIIAHYSALWQQSFCYF